MKIKILTPNKNDMWYNNRIGDVFTVVIDDDELDDFLVETTRLHGNDENERTFKRISKDDVEVLYF